MKELIQHLSSCITEQRKDLFDQILKQRTNYVNIVLENIFQPLNASAVLRSCECFGFQNVHVIEDNNTFNPDREVAMGSSNWLSIHRYEKTKDCIKKLKNKGYRIIATSPHHNSRTLQDFDLAKGKIALFFGTEMKGLSPYVMQEADELITIPMHGFTESLNLSVSAAICLHEMRNKMEQKAIKWQLSEKEKEKILLEWLRYSIDRSEIVEEDYWKNRV